MSNNWKIKISGVEQPVPVARVIEFCSKNNQSQLYGLRKELAVQNSEEELLTCHHCDTPVIVTRRKKKVYVKHKPSPTGDAPLLKGSDDSYCPFYQGKGLPIFDEKPRKESKLTKLLKTCVSENIKLSSDVKKKSIKVGKIITDSQDDSKWRSPHVYFEKKDGTKWAVEILRSWINPTLINERESFYRKNNINLMWVVYIQSMGIDSITFGDLMYGHSKEKNVFAISYTSIQDSFDKNDFMLHVFYPGDIGHDTVIGKHISFKEIKSNKNFSPYYKDCSSITLEGFRDYLVRIGAIESYSTDKEVIKAMNYTNATKIISAARRTSDSFLFNKRDILKSLTELHKIDVDEFPKFKRDIKSLEQSFNLNLKILETIEHPDGKRKIKRHLGQIASFTNSKSVFNNLNEREIISYDDLVSDYMYLKPIISDICEKKELSFDDFLKLNKAKSETTGGDSKKLKALIEILFSTTINIALSENKKGVEIEGKNELKDTFRIFYYLLSASDKNSLVDKKGSLPDSPNQYAIIENIFTNKKYSNEYYQRIFNNISMSLKKHRPISNNEI